jgi:hypothetical protein
MLDATTEYMIYTHPYSVVYDPSNCLGRVSRLGIVQVAAAMIASILTVFGMEEIFHILSGL